MRETTATGLAIAGDDWRTIAFGPVRIGFAANDSDAAAWLLESLEPCFVSTSETPQWRVAVHSSASAYAALRRQQPATAERRPCFAHDQSVVSLPAWKSADGVLVGDKDRSCFFEVGSRTVDLIADPTSLRWRFTLMWIFQEIVATCLRGARLDLHSACVETSGRALLLVGPKGAGKTTLSFHLLRSRQYRWIANDRSFLGATASDEADARWKVRGLPTAVKIRPPMDGEFAELSRDVPKVERPYLYNLAELSAQSGTYEASSAIELALSPAQVAQRFGIERLGTSALGAVVFPRVRPDVDGWRTQRLEPTQMAEALRANLYGGEPLEHRPPTVFEDVEDAAELSSDLAERVSRSVPGYRLELGRNAYVEPALSAGFRRLLLAP